MITGHEAQCFENSRDHLLAHLNRIELKLRLQVVKSRQKSVLASAEKFRGLYISEKEIDTIIGSPPLAREDTSLAGDDSARALSDALGQLESSIIAREMASRQAGRVLRLNELERLFGLSPFDIDALLVCILPELDLRYQRLYAYLQDDVTRKNPTVDLVLRLLCGSFEEALSQREAFSSKASLIRYGLLWRDSAPLLSQSLHVDERIVNYLLDIERVDARLVAFANLVQPAVRLADVVLHDAAKDRLVRLAGGFRGTGLICYLWGTYGVGKRTVAEAVSSELGVPLLVVDIERLAAADTPSALVLLVFREVLLGGAALYLEHFDILLGEDKAVKPVYDAILGELAICSQWVFIAGEREWMPTGLWPEKPFITVELASPPYPARQELWARFTNGRFPLAADVDLDDIASRFRLSGGQVRDALALARSLALWREPETGVITNEDLYQACRRQTGRRFSALAHKIEPRYQWDDIVLPGDQIEQLHEICGYVKHHHMVYEGWGFGRKAAVGKGLNVLFAGPSGTGKTMSADIMANELGLDLYKIDLSAIVSKYIGETEKNLDRIFREGQTSNAILFFDEADALFGKRSEVRDSHDRYANIEIAYLLQKMEEYDGVVILATNLRKNMDEAFARRMHFAVEFPIPEEADRYRIWQSIFPKEAPLAKEVDLSFLARQFKITGGNIRNVALSAAFLAAQDGGSITMQNLIRATKREYQKMGKLCTEGDFACYFDLVKG